MDKITKELNQHKRDDVQALQTDSVVQSVKGLLEDDAAKDRQILRSMGLDKHLQIAEDKQSKIMELEKLDNCYGGQVYHIDQIKKLAIDYHLKFLPSGRYSGSIDVQVPFKVREFATANKMDLTTTQLEYNFMMLAPAECFDLEKIVIDRDPALFYKIDDKHYRLIYKWGKDFTPFRYIQGLKWKSVSGFVLINILTALVFGSLLASIITPSQWFATGLYYLFLGAFSLISFIVLMSKNWNEGVITNNLSPNSWHSSKRYV